MASAGAAKEAVHVITGATRRKNMALAGALVAFVGSVYYFTYSKMKTVSGWVAAAGDATACLVGGLHTTRRRPELLSGPRWLVAVQNELEEVAKEFDLIREATGGVKPAAAPAGGSAPAAGTPPAQQMK